MVTNNKGFIISFCLVTNILVTHFIAVNKELWRSMGCNSDHVTRWHRQGLSDTWLAINRGLGWLSYPLRQKHDRLVGTPSSSGNQASGYSFVFNSVLDLYKHFPPNFKGPMLFSSSWMCVKQKSSDKGFEHKISLKGLISWDAFLQKLASRLEQYSNRERFHWKNKSVKHAWDCISIIDSQLFLRNMTNLLHSVKNRLESRFLIQCLG
jgi:hypothetical protein